VLAAGGQAGDLAGDADAAIHRRELERAGDLVALGGRERGLGGGGRGRVGRRVGGRIGGGVRDRRGVGSVGGRRGGRRRRLVGRLRLAGGQHQGGGQDQQQGLAHRKAPRGRCGRRKRWNASGRVIQRGG